MTVRTVKLGDVIEINPRSNHSLASNSNVAFLAMADISEDGQILATQTRPLSEVAKGYTSFQNGDVLLAKITPCFENGKAALVHGMFSGVAFGSTEFHVLRPTKEIDGRYLYHLVWNPGFRAAGARRMTGSAGQKRVPTAFLSDFEIALPRFEEQKRIAAILDKADSLRRKRQQAIRLADDFLRAVFLDLFGTHFESNQEAWRPIGEVTSFIDYRGKTPEKSIAGIPLLTAKNVKRGYLDVEPQEFIPEKNYLEWMTRGFPIEGDILFTTEAPLGNVAILPKYEKVALAQRVICIRGNEELTSEYLLFALQHPKVVDQIETRATGSTVKGIRSKELVLVKIPTPPITEQVRFSEISKKILLARAQQDLHCIESESFFNSLVGQFL